MPPTTPILNLLPTDTIPGLATFAIPDHLVHLNQALATLNAPPAPLTWHAHSPTHILDVLSALTTPLTSLAQRAISRLLPGPITLALERPSTSTPLPPHLQPHPTDHALWLRVPNHPQTLHFLSTSPHPLLARGITTPTATLCTTLAQAHQRLTSLNIPHTTLPGPDGSGQPTTILRLHAAGGYTIQRQGDLSPRHIHDRLALNLLFVCTGNTCRSPMAQRIATHLAANLPPGSPPILATSAGLSAYPGEPTTPHAIEALRRLDITARPTGAQPLTQDLITHADRIYVMTAAHLRQAHHAGATTATLLDPQGNDIPDPIGGTQHQYDHTAARIAAAIAARLKEPLT